MTKETIEQIGRALDAECGLGFTQKALGRLEALNALAEAIRQLQAQEAPAAHDITEE